jgi:hypothetical protein
MCGVCVACELCCLRSHDNQVPAAVVSMRPCNRATSPCRAEQQQHQQQQAGLLAELQVMVCPGSGHWLPLMRRWLQCRCTTHVFHCRRVLHRCAAAGAAEHYKDLFPHMMTPLVCSTPTPVEHCRVSELFWPNTLDLLMQKASARL